MSPQTEQENINPMVPIFGVVLAMIGIVLIVAVHAWWSMALAVVAELAVLSLVVVYLVRAMATQEGEEEGEITPHDLPRGAPERRAVRLAHEHATARS